MWFGYRGEQPLDRSVMCGVPARKFVLYEPDEEEQDRETESWKLSELLYNTLYRKCPSLLYNKIRKQAMNSHSFFHKKTALHY